MLYVVSDEVQDVGKDDSRRRFTVQSPMRHMEMSMVANGNVRIGDLDWSQFTYVGHKTEQDELELQSEPESRVQNHRGAPIVIRRAQFCDPIPSLSRVSRLGTPSDLRSPPLLILSLFPGYDPHAYIPHPTTFILKI